MATKKRETVAQKKARLDAIQSVLTAFGRRILEAKVLYVVGALMTRRPSRKKPESPISTNPPTEYAQADYRDKDGIKIGGPGSGRGAAVFKGLVGFRASVDKQGKAVPADKRLNTVLSMLFARMFPSGVQMMAAHGAACLPDELLAKECERRFGEQGSVAFDYIKACVAFTSAVTELTKEVKTSDKSGPVILE